eukprot:631485-Pelagomonas_calceolata.AAC.3
MVADIDWNFCNFCSPTLTPAQTWSASSKPVCLLSFAWGKLQYLLPRTSIRMQHNQNEAQTGVTMLGVCLGLLGQDRAADNV